MQKFVLTALSALSAVVLFPLFVSASVVEWTFPRLGGCHEGLAFSDGRTGVLVWGGGDEIRLTVGRGDLWDHRGGMTWKAEQSYTNIVALVREGKGQELKDLFRPEMPPNWGGRKNPTLLPLGRVTVKLPGAEIRRGELDTSTGVGRLILADGREIGLAMSRASHVFALGLPAGLEPAFQAVPSTDFPVYERVLRHRGFERAEKRPDGFTWKLPEDDPVMLSAVRRKGADGSSTILLGTSRKDPPPVAQLAAAYAFADAAGESAAHWRRFWQEGARIRVPDPAIQEVFDYGMYRFGAMTDPDGVPAGLQGPWLEDDRLVPWSGDYHFNINVQECYSPAFRGGHFANLKPLFRMVLSWRPVLRENARLFVGVDDGYALPHSVDDRGTCIGGFWAGTIDHASTAWVAALMMRYVRYSGDVAFLRDGAYDFMRGAMRVYRALMEEREGRLSIPMGPSPEWCGDDVRKSVGRDPSFQLAAARRLATDLMAAARLLGERPDPMWADVLARLPAYTLGPGGIQLFVGQDLAASHRHHSHLAGIYPFDTLDYGDASVRKAAEESYARWVGMGTGCWSGWCVPWAAILHVRAGQPFAAVHALHDWRDFFNNPGHGSTHDACRRGYTCIDSRSDIMQMDGQCAAATAVMELLAHETNGRVAYFRGCPEKWTDVSFENLALSDGTRVNGRRLNGVVTVTPVARADGAGRFPAAEATVAVASAARTEKGRRWEREAVDDLVRVLAAKTGRTPRVVEEKDLPSDARHVIYVGRTAAARRAGVDVGALTRPSCRILVRPDRVLLAADSGMGVSYGVTEFLERFADHYFLDPFGDDPVVRTPDLSFPAADFTFTPAIPCREIYHGVTDGGVRPVATGNWMSYMRRRRAHYTDEIEGRDRFSHQVKQCHSQFDYCPPEKYFKDHPEYYSMVGGVRRVKPVGQLCMTNPDVRRICVESLERFIVADRAKTPDDPPLLYDFSQLDDMQSLCQCPACREVIAKYNRVPGGHEEGGDTGLQLEFVNDIARRIAKTHPEILLRTFAYSSTEAPPAGPGIRPEGNVMIWYCDAYNYSDHDRPLADPYNARSHGLLDWWTRNAAHFDLWDYALYGGRTQGAFPDIQADAVAADARLFAARGVRRLFMETEYHEQAFYPLNYFLMSEFYVDPNRDLDELIGIYCRVYGRAAGAMRRAIDFWRENERAHPPQSPANWRQRILGWRSADAYAKLLPLLKAAYAEADTPAAKARVAHAVSEASIDFARCLKSSGRTGAEYAAAKSDYLAFGAEAAAHLPVEPSRRKELPAVQRETLELMDLSFRDLPPELRRVPASELVCVDYHRFYANPGSKISADAGSETGHALVYNLGGEQKVEEGVVRCGVHDTETKTGQDFDLRLRADAGEDYAWYRLGAARIGRGSIFWIPRDWKMNVWLKEYYLQCDGLAEDPNWYDAWVSVKAQGPAYVGGSRKPNGLFLDRLVFRRSAEGKRR